jgi:drug/metabolite transporter (DMT)-like permease
MAKKSDDETRMKLVCFVTLICTNVMTAMTVRYSRGILKESYSTKTTIFCTEILKMVLCIGVLLRENSVSVLAKLMMSSKLLSIPAGLYFCQNMIMFVALKNLESQVFSILYQTKILTTALFMVILLGKRLSYSQWKGTFLGFLA